MIPFQQIDTSASFFTGALTPLPINPGVNGALPSMATVGGVPGTIPRLTTLVSANCRNLWVVSFDLPVPQYTLWRSGWWTMRLNVIVGNPCLTWDRLGLYRVNSAGVLQSLMGQAWNLDFNLGTPGVKRFNRLYTEMQDTRAYGDHVIAVLSFVNGGTVPPYNLSPNRAAQPLGVLLDQVIDSPFTGGN